MDIGWIKISRSITNHWIWKDPVKFKWWMDILLMANFEPKKVSVGYKMFECKRGECLLSLKSWGDRWGVSKTVVNNFFTMLENDNMIKTVNETVTTRLIVCNYDSYQRIENGNKTKTKRKQNATKTQQSTTKEREENKEREEEDKPKTGKFTPPTILEVIDYFKQAGFTEKAAENAFNYYDVANWYDSKGSKVKNWKQKMRGVWFKDEYKVLPDAKPKRVSSLSAEDKIFT